MTDLETIKELLARATKGSWDNTIYCKRDGSPIKTIADIEETVSGSASYSDRLELFGVTLDDKDEDGLATVICYTGNGPNAHNNAALIATVVNQAEYDRDAPKLFDIPARRRGLSIEPMLGPINLGNRIHLGRLHWVICGGESEQPGHKPRPINPAWVRDLRMDCTVGGIAFHFKQWGAWAPDSEVGGEGPEPSRFLGGSMMRMVGAKKAGRKLDGRTWDQFPK